MNDDRYDDSTQTFADVLFDTYQEDNPYACYSRLVRPMSREPHDRKILIFSIKRDAWIQHGACSWEDQPWCEMPPKPRIRSKDEEYAADMRHKFRKILATLEAPIQLGEYTQRLEIIKKLASVYAND